MFRIYEHFINRELISSDNSVYFFDSNSVEFNKNILRLWIRGLKIDKEELKDSDAYDYQGLWEIDIKAKKVRTLSIVVFNKKNKIIDSITFDNPKWDYFPPGSITDSIMKYFNSKKTK